MALHMYKKPNKKHAKVCKEYLHLVGIILRPVSALFKRRTTEHCMKVKAAFFLPVI